MNHARSYARLLIPILALLVLPARAGAQPTLRGRVLDRQGVAMARVPVSLVSGDKTVVTTTITDAAGSFAFNQPCQRCRAEAVLRGFVTASADLSEGVEATLTMAMAPVRESMVISATRDAVPTAQIAASVTTFDAMAIERRGAVLVGDLLRQAPGAAVVQNGGQGNVMSLFVRGGESNYTKVLIDGIAINEPGGSFNFGGLSTGHLDRIEFVRGAHSALFGSDAVAGVLQLISRRGAAGTRPVIEGELGGGGYGTTRGAATVSGGSARWDYSLHGGRYETDNRSPNNGFESTTASLTAGGRISASTTLRVVGRYEDGRVGTPGQTAFGRPDLDAFFTQSHLVGGLSLEHQASSSIKQRLTYSISRLEQQSTNLLFDAPYTPEYQGRVAPFEFFDFTFDSANLFTRHQAGYQADLRVTHSGALAGAEYFTVAVDWDGERGTLADRLANSSISPSRDNFGATIQHQHLSRRFALTTGLRAEKNEFFGTEIVPRFSAAVFLGATKLKGNVGRGIKEPTMRQSFSLSPFDLGNPDLEAETSRSFDAGLEQRLFNDRLKVEAVWFDNRFENQINTRTLSFSPYQAQYFNLGVTRARGLELSVDAAPADAVRLIGHYTFTDSEVLEASSEFGDVYQAGNWGLRRPRHAAHLQALWERGRWSFDAAGAFVGRRTDSDFSSLEPPITSADGYWLWHARAAARIATAVTAYLRVENLTDKDYIEPLGYPAWRRTVHAGLRVKF